MRHQDSNPGRWIQSRTLYRLSYGRSEEIWAKNRCIWTNDTRNISINSKISLNKKFSDQFGEDFCFTNMGIGHLFSSVNFFLATLLQALYLVAQMVFFKKRWRVCATRGKMPLVNVVPHVVLHQKIHFLESVYFLARWKDLWAPCALLDYLLTIMTSNWASIRKEFWEWKYL